MIAAFDVDYKEDQANTGCVLFSKWSAAEPTATYRRVKSGIAPYERGSFYKRELPCILDMIGSLEEELTCLVVDGYVMLGEKKGLGMHLFEHFGGKVPVVGVAKTSFGSGVFCREVYRGQSQNPLYVTTAGLTMAEAASRIHWMHGEHRFPTLLKLVDTLSRQWPEEG